MPLQQVGDYFGYLIREQGRHGIAHLIVLFGAVALKEVVVREGLETGRFADGQAAALGRVVVDIVMSILADVAYYCAGRSVFRDYGKPVGKALQVVVVGLQSVREVAYTEGLSGFLYGTSGEEVAPEVVLPVGPGLMLEGSGQPRVQIPVGAVVAGGCCFQETSAFVVGRRLPKFELAVGAGVFGGG